MCKKGIQNTLLRMNIMSKSAFFAEIVYFFSERGVFFLCFFFLLKPAWRTAVAMVDFIIRSQFSKNWRLLFNCSDFLFSFQSLKMDSGSSYFSDWGIFCMIHTHVKEFQHF